MSADSNDLSNQIAQNAGAPRRAQGDSGSMEQHSLPDQIAADRYLASKAAMKSRRKGLRFVKFISPGAAGVDPGQCR